MIRRIQIYRHSGTAIKMNVIIIGAGVVGCAAAWEFLRQGANVTLLEGRSGPGKGTSHANGGQLSYDYVAPLADPGVFHDLPKWLLDPSSPLRFRPRLDPAQWCWLTSFLRACNAGTVRTSTTALLQLSYLSRDTLHAWLEETPIEFHHRQNGKLIAYRDPAKLEKARRQVEYQAQHGSKQRVLNRDETLALEPALGHLGKALAGAIYTPTEEAGDCYLFTRRLFELIEAHPAATVRTRARVQHILQSNGHVTGVRLESGETIVGDHYIVASGLQSRALLKPLGVSVPLYGLKGYSLSIPLPAKAQGENAADPTIAPDISVTDYERRIVYAKLGSVLRVAAMVDMGDLSADVNPARVHHLKAEVCRAFPRLAVEEAEVWAGERPATPEGRPIVGRSRNFDNLWLNIGHGALGFTLACGSAVLLHALLSQAVSPIDPAPFQLR